MQTAPGYAFAPYCSELAIRPSTPALMWLFSLVTLFAPPRMRQAADALRCQATWYRKSHPSFADALIMERKELWAQVQTFCGLPAQGDTIGVPRAFMERLPEAVCCAA